MTAPIFARDFCGIDPAPPMRTPMVLSPVVYLYILAVVMPIGFTLGPLAMTSLRLVLLVVTLPIVFRLIRGKYGPLMITDILFALFVVWGILAIGYNNPARVVENAGSVMLEFCGGYIIARAYIRTSEQFATLAKVLAGLVVISLPFALHETLTGRAILLEMIARIPGLSAPQIMDIDIRLGLERVQWTFAHPIHYGLFASVAFSLTVVGLKGHMHNIWRYVLGAFLMMGCFLALSSGALLALALQLFLIAWAWGFARVGWRWYLLIALGVIIYIAVDLMSTRTPMRVFMSYATYSSHNAFWRGLIFEWGMKNVLANPVFGIGLNDWLRPDFMPDDSIDNFWLVLAMRNGIPGAALLITGYLIAIAQIGLRGAGDDPLLARQRRAWIFTFVSLTFTLSTVHIWTSIFSFVFFIFGAGMWMARPADHLHLTRPCALPYSRFENLGSKAV